MATIEKRVLGDGTSRHKAIIRRKGQRAGQRVAPQQRDPAQVAKGLSLATLSPDSPAQTDQGCRTFAEKATTCRLFSFGRYENPLFTGVCELRCRLP